MKPNVTARKDFKIPAGIFVFAAIFLVVTGYFGWLAANYPVPDFWDNNIKKGVGIWKRGGGLQKLDAWRIES